MPEQFLHGVEVIEIDSGPRPIRTVRSAVIGLIGTAPDADEDQFPYHTPILIAGKRSEAAGLGRTGTLPAAIVDIFDQTGAMIVVIRVSEFGDDFGYGPEIFPSAQTVIGGVDEETGQYMGIQAFLAAENEVHVTPRILIAPESSHHPAVVNELLSVAERLRAVVIADGPNTNDSDAIDYRQMFGSSRLYLVDPWVRVWDREEGVEVVRPASARVAGLIAKSDAERGFWWSPSNQEIRGVMGTARSVDFALGDTNARANFLNEHEVTTIIQKTGFRLWGNRSCSADPELNTPDQIAQGKVYIDFDFTPPYPAEHITFRSHLVNDYLVEVLPEAS